MSQSLVNILIVFNKSDNQSNGLSSNNINYLFDSMKTSIRQMCGPNKFTIYKMSANDLKANDCWHLTTALVITVGNQSIDNFLIDNNNRIDEKHINFELKDLLIQNQNDFDFNSELFERKLNTYLTTDPKTKAKDCNNWHKNGSKIYLLTKDQNQRLIEESEHLFDSKVVLVDENYEKFDKNIDNSVERLEIIVNPKSEELSFDSKIYFSNLKTERLGHLMAFADITDSTMKLIESFNGIHGFIAVTNQQTSGRGRTQNEWLSPKGCAMFTLQLNIELNSNIGRKMAFIQHMAGLSVVRAINTIEGYENLDLGLKWPNDILWRKNNSKLSGTLVTSSFVNQKFNVLIGCGINVSNSEPSLCINDVIDYYNCESNSKLDYLKCEEVIARTVTQMEFLLKMSEEMNGIQTIKEMYTKYWIHSGEEIKLVDNQSERTVRIEGLDSEGYLLVKDLSDGSSVSLHPDGNRFDIMRNLIIPRKQN